MATRVDYGALTTDQRKLIRKELCVKERISFYSQTKYHVAAKTILFCKTEPSGSMLVPMVFGGCLLKETVNEDRGEAVDLNFTGELRDYQEPVFERCLDQLNRFGTCLLGAYTAFGKSITAIKLMCELNLLTMFMFTGKTGIKQWGKGLSNCTNAKVWVVGLKKPKEYNVIICMHRRWEKIDEEDRDRIGFFVIDEIHNLCIKTGSDALLSCRPKYILGLSATPEREDGMDRMLELLLGVRKRWIMLKSPRIPTVYTYKTGITQNIAGKTWVEYLNDLAVNKERNDMICKIIQKVLEKDINKIIVLTRRVLHADILAETLTELGITVSCLYSNMNSYQDSRVLIGTTDKIGEQFDEVNFCEDFNGTLQNIVFLCMPIKSYKMIYQGVGRIRDENPNVVDILDGDRWAKNHYRERKKEYNEMRAIFRDIEIEDDEVTLKGLEEDVEEAEVLDVVDVLKELEDSIEELNEC